MISMKKLMILPGVIFSVIFLFSCKKEKTGLPPEVSTGPVSAILYTTAKSGGEVTSDGGAFVYNRGICWSKNSNPTTSDNRTSDGAGTGAFSSSLTGLEFGTKYWLRAYATNNGGTEYGSELSFTTKSPGLNFNSGVVYGTVSDVQGKNYKTVRIGSQEWMAENLRTTKLNDGTEIPRVAVNAQWINYVTPAYCWYNNNDTLYGDIYGAYYNWFTVNTGKLCPDGWHVPSDAEWQVLIDFLGGENTSGSKLKEVGINNWVMSNRDATNSTGFTAIPGGLRLSSDGSFIGQGYFGGWWSSTEIVSSPLGEAFSRSIYGDTTVIAHNQIFKIDGFSVRCIKN